MNAKCRMREMQNYAKELGSMDEMSERLLEKQRAARLPFGGNTFSVNFKLRIFEGPLDLLLALIKEAKIDIKDIFVSEITNQYIEYVASMDATSLQLDYISDFIEMAATLLEIKSKKLLPQVERIVEGEEIKDENWLIRQLEEYKLFKEMGEVLKGKESIGAYYREPDYDENDYKTVFKNFSMKKLIEAFAVVLHRTERRDVENQTRKIVKERYSVANRLVHILGVLRGERRVSFFSLFEEDYTKLEKINTFLALLELLKKQLAVAVQEEYYSDIFLEAREDVDVDGLGVFADLVEQLDGQDG